MNPQDDDGVDVHEGRKPLLAALMDPDECQKSRVGSECAVGTPVL
jgi:hypothetical protein